MSDSNTNNSVYIQNLFTSRDNFTEGNVQQATANALSYVGQEGRIWWEPTTNAFYYSNGNTPGGIPVGTSSGNGLPHGPNNAVQLNAGNGWFAGSSNLIFANNVLSVIGNVTAGNLVANTIVNDGSGNVYITGNLLPTAESYTLGTLAVPWGNAFFGPQSVTILDNTGNIANTVTIENIAANITMGTAGFNIVKLGTTNSIFRIEALTGQIFSNAQTIIANTTNASNTTSGALQTAGGAGIAKDMWVGGNVYGNVVTKIIAGVGLTQTANIGSVGIDATGVQTVSGTANQINVANTAQNLTLSLPQSIATTSTLTFGNLTITGNLTVNGTTTTANASALDSKILYLANTSTSNTQIDGGGIVLGNATSSYKQSILYDLVENRWNTNSAGFNTSMLSATDANIANLIAYGNAHFGAAFEGYDYPNGEIQIDSNINSYSQVIFINHSPGTNASTDYVATNNIGNDGSNYIDMGINSNTYANTDYAVSQANDGYLYVNGGNLVIGTQSGDNVISFFTGGTSATSYIRAQVVDTGLVMKNTSVRVQDGSDNSVIELQTNGNIVFNGSATLNLTSGFHVSSVSTNNGDANIVNYVGGAFVYGPALKDYAGNLKANNFSATGNITANGNITGGNIVGNVMISGNTSVSGFFTPAKGVLQPTRLLTGNTVAIDFATDELIRIKTSAPGTTITASFANLSTNIGKTIEVITFSPAGGSTSFIHGVSSSQSTNSNSLFVTSHQTMYIKYFNFDGTTGNLYVTAIGNNTL